MERSFHPVNGLLGKWRARMIEAIHQRPRFRASRNSSSGALCRQARVGGRASRELEPIPDAIGLG